METSELIFTGLGALFVLLAAYGVLKLNRRNFLLGIFLWSLLPVVGEFQAYMDTGEWGMLATMMAFIGMAIVTAPTKVPLYGSDNAAATAIARKIGVAIIAVNVFQGYIILSVRDDVAAQYGYYHFAIALIVIWAVLKTNSDQGFKWQ